MPAADLDIGAGDCAGHGGEADTGGTGKPDDIPAAGETGDASAGCAGQIPGVLAGMRRGACGILPEFLDHERFSRTRMACNELFPELLDAVDVPGDSDRDDAIGIANLCGTVIERNDCARGSGGDTASRAGFQAGGDWSAEADEPGCVRDIFHHTTTVVF